MKVHNRNLPSSVLSLALLVSCLATTITGPSNSFFCDAATTSIRWGSVDDLTLFDFLDFNTSDPDSLAPRCEYEGEILLSHPMSVGFDDRHYVLGIQMLKAAQISVDKINLWPRCGVTLDDGKNYSLTLQTYGDASDGEATARIGQAIVNVTDFMLAGYSSSLTAHLTPIAQENGRLCLTGGSSRTSVHADRDFVFGLNPPSTAYLEYAFYGAESKGAKTVAYLAEESANACDGAPGMAEKYGMTLLEGFVIPEESELSVFEDVARNVSVLNPDLMITCARTRITNWNQAMRNIDWVPKAQVYTYVVGSPEFEELMGPADLPYLMGVSSWDRALPPIPDLALGWTPGEFDAVFEQAAFRRPAYQHVQQSAVISVLTQAIERVGNYENQTAIRDVVASNYFPTVYGNVSFDENGQNAVPFLLLQYDSNGKLHVLLPDSQKFTDFEMVYPLPTWKNRDCESISDCVESGGICAVDGSCTCDPETHESNGYLGEAAECLELEPEEVSTQNLILVATIPVVTAFLLIAGLFLYYLRMQAKNDTVWQIKRSELVFEDPPEVIGRGTFGEVLLAEFRGTQVAVKCVLPPSSRKYKKNKGTSTSSTSGGDVRIDSTTAPEHSAGMRSTNTDILEDSHRTKLSDRSKQSGMSSGLITTSERGRVKSSSTASYRSLKKDFVHEMRYLSKLRHPCITTVMGAINSPTEEPMLVMEYMEYGSLSELLQNETMLLEGELLLPMLQDISRGCRFLHAADPEVIHGDLKSANILVDSKFRAKVADFGLSQKKRIGAATGTPYFMAPELLRQETVNTAASDVYSFGIILYEVYSRKDPYEGEDFNEVLRAVADPFINKRPPVPADCPPQMCAIMSDCIVADPEERPTFEEVDKRLGRVELKSAGPTTSSYLSEKRSTVSLFDIFPRHIAEKLRNGEKVEPESHDLVTIFFCDIVGFTSISATLEPGKIANMLDRLYHKFDALSEKHDVFKVETIGDAYMAVTNLVKKQPDDHVKRIAEFAVDAVREANDTLVDLDDHSKGYVNIRVGFHSGPVVSDVVGSRNPRYCLFGDAVNTAARMESNSIVNRIMCSEASANILKQQDIAYPIRSRGLIEVKGKGKMHTYWINEGRGEVKTMRQLSIRQSHIMSKVAFQLPVEAENGDWSSPVVAPKGPKAPTWSRIGADGSIASSQTGDSHDDSVNSGSFPDEE